MPRMATWQACRVEIAASCGVGTTLGRNDRCAGCAPRSWRGYEAQRTVCGLADGNRVEFGDGMRKTAYVRSYVGLGCDALLSFHDMPRTFPAVLPRPAGIRFRRTGDGQQEHQCDHQYLHEISPSLSSVGCAAGELAKAQLWKGRRPAADRGGPRLSERQLPPSRVHPDARASAHRSRSGVAVCA